MKRLSILSLILAVFVVTSGCDALKNMIGGRGDDSHTYSANNAQQPPSSDQKIKELEDKMKKMEDEAKARTEAENKAKAEEELKAKLEQEIRAKLEAEQKLAATQPTTKPTEKVVERIIVRDAVPAAPVGSAPAAKASGYVRLYDDAGFTDRILTVRFGRDLGDLNYTPSDDGKAGFNDKASSVKYSVPAGWQAVLYENNNYSKRGYALKGTGSIPDLGYFGDKCSSIRWEKISE